MAITQLHIENAIELAKDYNVNKLLLFGSAVTDPYNANDLDLAVEILDKAVFYDFAGMLEYILNVPVDVVDLSIESPFTSHIKEIGKIIYDKSSNIN